MLLEKLFLFYRMIKY
jgi:drug/metabolite transporter (DMT)-like permease